MSPEDDDLHEDEDNPGMDQYGDPYEGPRGPSVAELDAQTDADEAYEERAARRRVRPILEQIKALPEMHDRELVLRWLMLYVDDYGNFIDSSMQRRQIVHRISDSGAHEYC